MDKVIQTTAAPWEVHSREAFDPGCFSIEPTTAEDNGGKVIALLYGPDAKANAHLVAVASEMLALLIRYRNETPLGHQPHMIAREVDAVISRSTPQGHCS